VGRAEVMDRWPKSNGEALHTSTFLGNPLGCRVALAQLEHLEQSQGTLRLDQKSQLLQKELERLGSLKPGLINPRTRGLLGAIDVVDLHGRADGARAAKIMIQALHSGLILLASGAEGNVLSFTPPLVIEEQEIERGFEILSEMN
jgi:4-aminobutyrate aminotransferase-like enzyme